MKVFGVTSYTEYFFKNYQNDIMKKIAVYALLLILLQGIEFNGFAQSFQIRGVLPWHNFLSGPTAWNLEDYRNYLDDCQEQGINLIAFHNYTGGGERYFNYVEPMIRIQYKNVLPEAGFDHSGTARWGYLPMKVADFAFGTDTLFDLPPGAEYFGADAAVTAYTNEERYEQAQALMQDVMKMAHERNIEMAMGFEFGVAPPEYASIRTHTDMYWMGSGSLIYNPFDPDAIGILHATIDDIIDTYQGIDWIYLWLNEHCMFGVDPAIALRNRDMEAFYQEYQELYAGDGVSESTRFLGVWAQAYIQRAYDYIRLKAPDTKIVIGGWGAESQMASLLRGMDRALPEDIVFSMLNPGQGLDPHPDFFKEIAEHRKVWAIPWLESDYALWHFQPNVKNIKDHIQKAYHDGLDGVVAIHWRTEEIRLNWETFAHFAAHPKDTTSWQKIYRDFCRDELGTCAEKKLAPAMIELDASGLINSIRSEEYYAYRPAWGRLTPEQLQACKQMSDLVGDCISVEANPDKIANLKWFGAYFEFAIYLDKVGRLMQPAWDLRASYLLHLNRIAFTQEQIDTARDALSKAPVEKMINAFASRVRSRGELGELSSINQRIWREYQLLTEFMDQL